MKAISVVFSAAHSSVVAIDMQPPSVVSALVLVNNQQRGNFK
jgi:hypothetical protein